MKPALLFVIIAFLIALSGARSGAESRTPPPGLAVIPALGVDLNKFVWTNRLVVVFADNPADPAYITQLQALAADPAALVARDVVVITDAQPADNTALRAKLRPHGFSLVWIDKDGAVRLRKPLPWSVRELVQAIDKTPLRREELAEHRAGG